MGRSCAAIVALELALHHRLAKIILAASLHQHKDSRPVLAFAHADFPAQMGQRILRGLRKSF